jgi:hypothetical protein
LWLPLLLLKLLLLPPQDSHSNSSLTIHSYSFVALQPPLIREQPEIA